MANPAFKNPYQAVSIAHGLVNCQAVRDIQGKRFLASEAPMLPLEDCTESNDCMCKYQKWDDRRQEDRRMSDSGIGGQYFHGEEKRSIRRGRRSTD